MGKSQLMIVYLFITETAVRACRHYAEAQVLAKKRERGREREREREREKLNPLPFTYLLDFKNHDAKKARGGVVAQCK